MWVRGYMRYLLAFTSHQFEWRKKALLTFPWVASGFFFDCYRAEMWDTLSKQRWSEEKYIPTLSNKSITTCSIITGNTFYQTHQNEDTLPPPPPPPPPQEKIIPCALSFIISAGAWTNLTFIRPGKSSHHFFSSTVRRTDGSYLG